MKTIQSLSALLIIALALGCKKDTVQDKNTLNNLLLKSFNLKNALPSSVGAIYYVSPSGSDSNNGTTTSTPWQTITKVNSHSYAPNDQILFLGGSTFNGTISINSSGSSGGAYIKFSSYGSGNATINGGTSGAMYELNQSNIWLDQLSFVGSWNSASQTGNSYDGIEFQNTNNGAVNLGDVFISNCIVSGFKYSGINITSNAADNSQSGFVTVTLTHNSVHDNGSGGIQTSGPEGTSSTSTYAYPNVYIANNVVYNNYGFTTDVGYDTGNGIRIQDASSGTIEHNIAHDNGKFNKYVNGGPVGIWCFDSKNLIFQYNESYNNSSGTNVDGDGMDLDGGTTNCIMQYNYTHGNGGSGILVWEYGDHRGNNGNNIIRYNISENDGKSGGIYAGITQGRSGSGNCNDNKYYNNTIYSAFSPALYVLVGGTNNVFYNNIFYANNSGLTIACDAARSDVFFLNNNYYSGVYGLRIYYMSTSYYTLASFRSATTQEQYYSANYGFNTDPKLANPGAGIIVGTGNPSVLSNYKLIAGSPMIDNGFNLVSNWGYNVGGNDFNGLSIPYNTAYDNGACEYHP